MCDYLFVPSPVYIVYGNTVAISSVNFLSIVRFNKKLRRKLSIRGCESGSTRKRNRIKIGKFLPESVLTKV